MKQNGLPAAVHTPVPPVRFGRFVVRPASRELLVDNEPVRLGARAFDLLLVLMDCRGRVVSADELMAHVWPGVIVEENNIQVHVSALRKVMGTQAIATVPGRGYQFNLTADATPSEPTAVQPDRPTAPTASAPPSAYPTNLPRQMTSFIGRVSQMVTVASLLQSHRLLTLVGAGGCGKTRLSLQIAEQSFAQFPGGTWLLELAPLADPNQVLQGVANALGVKEASGKVLMQSLIEHIAGQQMLLLMDNCEHLLAACGQMADALLHTCPGLKIMASSRQALGVAGEQAYRVPALSLPDPNVAQTPQTLLQYESVLLFVDRGRLLRPDFEVDANNASAVVSLCSHLDGIPLAIELAAARLNLLTVAEIERRLNQRFRLLTGGSRSALPRHQTLLALIDWSYALLNDSEKLLLSRLAVFVGGWRLDAAEAVCVGEEFPEWEIFELLSALIDKSLVVVDQMAGLSRFRLLETVREYALEKLNQLEDAPLVRALHCEHYLNVVEEPLAQLPGFDQGAWLLTVESENENLLAALDWSLEKVNAKALWRLCAALGDFWIMQGRLSQGRAWFERALTATQATVQSPDAVRAMNAAGALCLHQGDLARTRHWYQTALAHADAVANQPGLAAALHGLGLLALALGQFDAARTQSEQSLAMALTTGDKRAVAKAQFNLGAIALSVGDFVQAKSRLENALAWTRQNNDRWNSALVLQRLGMSACLAGDSVQARGLFDESLGIYQSFNDLVGTSRVLACLGLVAHQQADPKTAASLYRQSLVVQRALSDKSVTAISLEGIAEVLAALGQPLRAAQIWGATERLRTDIGSPLRPAWRKHCEGSIALARKALKDNTRFDKAWKEGSTLSFDLAMALVFLDDQLDRQQDR